MRIRHVAALSLLLAASPLGDIMLPGPGQLARAADAPVSFKDDVLPILMVHCAACHSPGGAGAEASGLVLTTYQGVMKGTKFGPMVVPGDTEGSNLMRLLDWRAGSQLRMPHDKKQLPVGERDTIRAWIRQGAKNN